MNENTQSHWPKGIGLPGVWEHGVSCILQGVLISGKHRQITVSAAVVTAVIDCCADTVLIVACCAVPVAPSSHCSRLTPAKLSQPLMSNY